MASLLVQSLVNDVRGDSDLNSSQIYTDSGIATLLSDAGSSLYDLFSGANQHYNVSTFDFSLVGGVGQNSVPLPADFQQGHSVDVNPNTSQPYTLRYLPNWLDRNKLSGAGAIWGASGGPREYYFLSSNPGSLVVLPAMAAGGNFRLYYTPMWTPLALPSPISVQTASIQLTPTTTMGFLFGSVFQLDAGPNTFTAQDAVSVGNFLQVTGATNPSNNGFWTIGSVVSPIRVGVGGSPISETFPPSAVVNLFRQSGVTAAGTWTFYGANASTNSTINVGVGDVITVSGAVNAGNNGSFTVTQAASGGNTVVTADAAGLVAENFAAGTVTVTVQAAGTRADLPVQMNPWILYLKTLACITIRNKRGQDVASFTQRLAVDQQRIEKILQERQEEPTQPPLTRGCSGAFWDF